MWELGIPCGCPSSREEATHWSRLQKGQFEDDQAVYYLRTADTVKGECVGSVFYSFLMLWQGSTS